MAPINADLYMLLQYLITQTSADPTFPALLITQRSQVQLRHFRGKALLLVPGILSPLQFGVRYAGMLLNLHRGALE